VDQLAEKISAAGLKVCFYFSVKQVVSIPSMLRDHGVVLSFENKQVNGPSDNSVHKGTNK
jgi:hypothetical protein